VEVSVDHVKLRFYRVFNCIYAQCHSNNSEMITVQLMNSYCLPFCFMHQRLYQWSVSNVRCLDNCINTAIYKIFNVGSSVYSGCAAFSWFTRTWYNDSGETFEVYQ